MTAKQKRIVDFVAEYWRVHGYGPSYEAMMIALDYRSKGALHAIVSKLVDNGYLERGKARSARSLRVARPDAAAVLEQVNETLKKGPLAINEARNLIERALK